MRTINNTVKIDIAKVLPTIYDEKKPQKRYVLRLELDDSPVRIYRDIECPSNIRLSYLADLLVRTMGWLGYHQHEFTKDDIDYVSTSSKEYYDDEGLNREYYDFNDFTLGDLLKKKGDQMTYTYDLGDVFQHTLTLREVHRYTRRNGRPIVPDYYITGGRNSCPPDDVGGIGGYEHMLKVLDDPEDEEFSSFVDWLPDDFDPYEFHIQEARKRIWDFLRTIETIRLRLDKYQS